MPCIASTFDENQRRGFQERLDTLHEHRGVPAVYHAVIEARRKIHHLAGDERRTVPYWTHHHLVDADDRHLGMIDNGRRHQTAHRPERGNCDGRAAELLAGGCAGSRGLSEPGNLSRTAPDIEGLDVSDNWHHETCRCLRRDANIYAGMLMNDAFHVVEYGIQLGLILDRSDHGTHQERQE